MISLAHTVTFTYDTLRFVETRFRNVFCGDRSIGSDSVGKGFLRNYWKEIFITVIVSGFLYFSPRYLSRDIKETIIYTLKIPFSKRII